jgi:hypothetical protein
MLRVPQHERKKINDISSFPFVTSTNSVQALSAVEGLLRVFQQSASLEGRSLANLHSSFNNQLASPAVHMLRKSFPGSADS